MRTRRTVLLSSALVVASVATAVRADAPPGQYQTFYQSSVCITDAHTNLVWSRAALGGPGGASFTDAASICAALGKTDGWRVPSVNELSTLVDDRSKPQFDFGTGGLLPKAIDANAFPDTPVDLVYWTSNLHVGGSGEAWAINFATGESLWEPTSTKNYVRCVTYLPPTAPRPKACP